MNLHPFLRSVGRPSPTRQALALALTSAALTASCGGAQTQLTKSLADRDTSGYLKVCEERSAKQASDLSTGAYNPPILYVHKWEGHSETLLPENQLTAVLENGEVKNVLVTARGGLGKTRLAESIHGQLCAVIPVFNVDLKVVAKFAGPGNALLGVIAQNAGVPAEVLVPQLAEGRMLVLADGIEEVDLVNRAKVMSALRDASVVIPAGQFVLLTRPPILDADYGFTAVDAKLEIQPLDCKTTDAFVARSYKDENTREQFQRFLQHYGLDEKSTFGVQCTMPYLSTYRDVLAMADFYQKSLDPASGIIASRTNVYEALIGVRLRKELENLGWTQVEALDMLDRMVRVAVEGNGFRDPRFDMAGCVKSIDARWGTSAVDAGVAGTPEQRRQHVCEKTFQSALFAPADGNGRFKFADPGTTDLFLARWLNGELARQSTIDCQTILSHGDLLNTADVLRFFVSQPLGQRCVAPVIDERCGRDPKADTVAVLDEGLPIGQARKQIVAEARAMESRSKNKACVSAALKSLEATISAP